MNKINKKRIGIDARFYGPVGKGLGRYTKELTDSLLEIDDINDYVVFLGRDNFDEFKTENPRVKKVLAPVRWYTLAEQIKMPFLIWKEKIDLMHFHHFNVPVFCPSKFVVTIHDLILIKFPSRRASRLSPYLYWIKNTAYYFVLRIALMRSEKIIAVSEFTKKDILENFKLDSDKIFVTYEGVSKNLLSLYREGERRAILEKYQIKKPFLLYVGNAYPHKNLEWLIDVYFESKYLLNFELVLVGKEDYFYKRLKDQVLNLTRNGNFKRVIFPGYIPDEELSAFFQEASIYIFPSKYEGFGIPPLEAMANHCPVLSSNAASMPEILGEAAIYFNPENKESMIKAIRITENKEKTESLIRKGIEQVKKYSWLDCSKKTLRIINDIN